MDWLLTIDSCCFFRYIFLFATTAVAGCANIRLCMEDSVWSTRRSKHMFKLFTKLQVCIRSFWHAEWRWCGSSWRIQVCIFVEVMMRSPLQDSWQSNKIRTQLLRTKLCSIVNKCSSCKRWYYVYIYSFLTVSWLVTENAFGKLFNICCRKMRWRERLSTSAASMSMRKDLALHQRTR